MMEVIEDQEFIKLLKGFLWNFLPDMSKYRKKKRVRLNVSFESCVN